MIQEWVKVLEPLSQEARISVRGGDRSMLQQRRVARAVRALCDAIDGFLIESSPTHFLVGDPVRHRLTGHLGHVTAPWFKGGVWIDDTGPYAALDIEKIAPPSGGDYYSARDKMDSARAAIATVVLASKQSGIKTISFKHPQLLEAIERFKIAEEEVGHARERAFR